jgi:hypothetical protein
MFRRQQSTPLCVLVDTILFGQQLQGYKTVQKSGQTPSVTLEPLGKIFCSSSLLVQPGEQIQLGSRQNNPAFQKTPHILQNCTFYHGLSPSMEL